MATYVHRFKWEANRCKFDNDATTIRIFLKGLKNVCTIAFKVYEKGPQTLTETIKEVEKLQAAQQITCTLLPTSLVNTMSSDNDRCFQCQEIGHMACYCPHIYCCDCDNYGHVGMDCPDKILPLGTPSHHRTDNKDRNRRSSSRQPSHTRHSCHDHKDRSRFSRSQSRPHNYSYRSNSQHEHHRTAPDPSIDLSVTAPRTIWAPVYIATAETCPTSDLLTTIPPEMTADLSITPNTTNTNHSKDHQQQHEHHLKNMKTRNKNINKLSLMIHHQTITVQMKVKRLRGWFKLGAPSPKTHSWRGLPIDKVITIAHITDCPTVTVHARKCYQALIDSGAAISLIRHSTYKQIEDCYKTPIQSTVTN